MCLSSSSSFSPHPSLKTSTAGFRHILHDKQILSLPLHSFQKLIPILVIKSTLSLSLPFPISHIRVILNVELEFLQILQQSSFDMLPKKHVNWRSKWSCEILGLLLIIRRKCYFLVVTN